MMPRKLISGEKRKLLISKNPLRSINLLKHDRERRIE
jgi:hypothetical protein